MTIIGWDIGGAHLKLARVEDGDVVDVRQMPCPLWLGLDRLRAAIDDGLTGWPSAAVHAVTMTGELTDLFASRAQGVQALLETVEARIGGARIGVYASDGTFLTVAEAEAAPERVASANWHASARVAATAVRHGLFVDLGSTTTDLVPLRGGAVAARGMSDAARLASDELIYRGVVRTPVMAVVQRVAIDGAESGVIAEHFATMADVYRLTGELPDHADQHPTADNRGKSLAESRIRLARMVGRDAAEARPSTWDELARTIAARQLAHIAAAAGRVTADAGLPADAPLIGAGVGRFLLPALARQLERPYRSFADIITASDRAIAAISADCAPAVAVALLFGAA